MQYNCKLQNISDTAKDCNATHQRKYIRTMEKVTKSEAICYAIWGQTCLTILFGPWVPAWVFLPLCVICFVSILGHALITLVLFSVKYWKTKKKVEGKDLSADAKAAEAGASDKGIAFIMVDDPPSYYNVTFGSPVPSYKSAMLPPMPGSPAPSYKSYMLPGLTSSPTPSYKSDLLPGPLLQE